MTKSEWLSKNGFSEDGFIYAIAGENTYVIKDTLKSIGCRYNPLLRWYSSEIFDLPEGYVFITFSFDDLYQWSEADGNAYMYEHAKVKIERAFAEAKGPSRSEYVGSKGERLYSLPVTYSSCRGFNGKFGYTYIYTFYSAENCIVWFTTKELNFEKGQPLLLTGTVVGHEEYRFVKTTKVNRCILKPLA